jgi:uncharacterized membrane protein
MRVLLCGESWVTHSLHIKGVDSFTTSSYVEGADQLRAVLTGSGIEVDYLPGHLVPAQFPASAGDLAGYTAVILSDIGANSILLAPQTFEHSQPAPDRLAAIEGYVRAGGGLLMIGGYLSFAGIEGKARYHGTPVEDASPVLIADVDDRVEAPAGVGPVPVVPGHPVLAGVPGPWPALLGYNRVTPRPEAEVVVRCGPDPLVACGQYHAGRSAVFTSDCAPHWAPPTFMDWPGYRALWPNLIRWLAGPG